MKIEFWKSITGEEEIPVPLQYSKKPIKMQDKRRLRKAYWDKDALNKHLVGELTQAFEALGYDIQPGSSQDLYVARPHPFALHLHSSADEGRRWNWTWSNSSIPAFENGCTEVFGLRKRIVPCYSEIVTIDIKGMISYEQFSGVHPEKELDALLTLGYSTKVITTPSELEDVMKEILEKMKK